MNSRSILSLAGLAVLAVVAAAVLGGCPPEQPIEVRISAGEERRAMSRDEILAQAKREGEVTFYTSLPQQQAEEIAQHFMQHFPFLTCRVVRSGTFEIVRRVQGELNRGEVNADVLHVLDPGVFVSLQEAGRLYRYQSSQAKYLPPSLRSPSYWNACRIVVTVLAWRADKPLKLRRWRDITSLPRSVRIGIKDAETSGSAYATYYLLREKYGYSFWEAIAARRPQIYRSEAEMIAALRSGEVDLLVGVMAHTAAAAEGVRVLWPEDGVPMIIGPLAIIAGAPHPNAAKLLVDFMLSYTGQEMVRDVTGAYPARPDVPGPRNLEPFSALDVLRPRAPWDLYTALQDYLQAEYHDLFRPSSE